MMKKLKCLALGLLTSAGPILGVGSIGLYVYGILHADNVVVQIVGGLAIAATVLLICKALIFIGEKFEEGIELYADNIILTNEINRLREEKSKENGNEKTT